MRKNPSHKVYERRWKEHARQLARDAAQPTYEELTARLRETLRALKQHVADDAKAANVPVERYCPCTGEEIARAESALAKIGGAA